MPKCDGPSETKYLYAVFPYPMNPVDQMKKTINAFMKSNFNAMDVLTMTMTSYGEENAHVFFKIKAGNITA